VQNGFLNFGLISFANMVWFGLELEDLYVFTVKQAAQNV